MTEPVARRPNDWCRTYASRATLYRLIADGEVKAFRVGGMTFITEESTIAWLKRRGTPVSIRTHVGTNAIERDAMRQDGSNKDKTNAQVTGKSYILRNHKTV